MIEHNKKTNKYKIQVKYIEVKLSILLIASIFILSSCSNVMPPQVKEASNNSSTPHTSESKSSLSEVPSTSEDLANDMSSDNEKYDVNDEIKSLPPSYNPYILEASSKSKKIYKELYNEFDEASHIQTKRSPGTIEFFVRTLITNPASGAITPTEDPFPEYDMPYFSQWDQRWAFDEYAGGLFGQTGCGPTVMAMLYQYFTDDEDMTPNKIAKFSIDNGYAIKDNGTAWTFFSQGAEKLGLKARELPLVKNLIINEVNNNHPIVLVVGPGHFTTGGHYVIIHGIKNGEFLIYDPFTISNCYRTFSFEEIADQIRNIWAYSN